jgi:aspartate/methionine/tyrosine aminotransferase
MQNDYFSVIQNRLKERQTQLLETLDKTGLDYVKCSAGYFVLADASKIDFPYDPKSDVPRDHQLCRWLPEHVGLMAIPPSVFYSPQHKRLAENYIRLAFCKKKETLDNAKPGFEKLATFIK